MTDRRANPQSIEVAGADKSGAHLAGGRTFIQRQITLARGEDHREAASASLELVELIPIEVERRRATRDDLDDAGQFLGARDREAPQQKRIGNAEDDGSAADSHSK